MANFIERNQQRKEIFSSPGNWIAPAAWFNERKTTKSTGSVQEIAVRKKRIPYDTRNHLLTPRSLFLLVMLHFDFDLFDGIVLRAETGKNLFCRRGLVECFRYARR
jgi:hypothetical protein